MENVEQAETRARMEMHAAATRTVRENPHHHATAQTITAAATCLQMRRHVRALHVSRNVRGNRPPVLNIRNGTPKPKHVNYLSQCQRQQQLDLASFIRSGRIQQKRLDSALREKVHFDLI